MNKNTVYVHLLEKIRLIYSNLIIFLSDNKLHRLIIAIGYAKFYCVCYAE